LPENILSNAFRAVVMAAVMFWIQSTILGFFGMEVAEAGI